MIIRYFLGYKKTYDWSQNIVQLNSENVLKPNTPSDVSLFVDESNNNMLSYKNYENEIVNIMEGEIKE